MTPVSASDLSACLMIALASASISMTLTQTELFTPLRLGGAQKRPAG